MTRIASAATAVLLLALSGGVIAAQAQPKIAQQSRPQSVTVGVTTFDFDAAEPPVAVCVTQRIEGQQDRVTLKGVSIVQLADGSRAVGGEWGPKDVTDLPGWRDAHPDDCDAGITWGGGRANQ